MTPALSIPAVNLPAHLGVPDQRTLTQLAELLAIDPGRLAPSRLVREGPTVLALRYTVARLRGEHVDPVNGRAWYLAGAWAEAIEAGEVYSMRELGIRMQMWGMGFDLSESDDWLVRLHQAGAAEQFAAGGWAQVRRWSRELVREGA